MRLVRDGKRVRLMAGDVLLSEAPAGPGATGTPLDVAAAAVVALAPGPGVAILGFAAGSILAPLRGLGCAGEVSGVDRAPEGDALFLRHASAWAGRVRLARADALEWLERRRDVLDAIVEDLSEEVGGTVRKPWISVHALPRAMARRLAPGGLAVVNLIPWAGTTWRSLSSQVAAPFAAARVVEFEDYENRLLLLGRELPTARWISRRLRELLRELGPGESPPFRVRGRLP